MILAVLGGSNGGYATAADLALAGHRLRLWSRSEADLAPVRESSTITLEVEGRRGVARLELATTDLAEAVTGAEIVIVPLPATGHDDLAKRLAPHVKEEQIILLTPGTLGSYALARVIARAG
ncbi:MAG: NAD(P)-binding domain-containing protein, partial [Candidatus Rokubacteria bacterium]|nr:NAD(P)-binding domain-containing protein [Candidatus Rokubacteria bacterium]